MQKWKSLNKTNSLMQIPVSYSPLELNRKNGQPTPWSMPWIWFANQQEKIRYYVYSNPQTPSTTQRGINLRNSSRVEFNPKGEINNYITRIKKKINFIETRLRPLLHFEMRKSMWCCFIRPLIDYIYPIILDQPVKIKDSIDRITRVSFKK